jgi:hypothetical protein
MALPGPDAGGLGNIVVGIFKISKSLEIASRDIDNTVAIPIDRGVLNRSPRLKKRTGIYRIDP